MILFGVFDLDVSDGYWNQRLEMELVGIVIGLKVG